MMLQDFKGDLRARSNRVEWGWLAKHAKLEVYFE